MHQRADAVWFAFSGVASFSVPPGKKVATREAYYWITHMLASAQQSCDPIAASSDESNNKHRT
jgi:hypothetical protein